MISGNVEGSDILVVLKPEYTYGLALLLNTTPLFLEAIASGRV